MGKSLPKIPLTRPVYMQELGQRMGCTTREARRIFRRLEKERGERLLFKARRTSRSRVWTTDALITKHCKELVDKPKRISQETRQFVKHVTEKLDDLTNQVEHLKAANDQGLSELRAELERMKRKGPR